MLRENDLKPVYTVGLLFNEAGTQVALIRKQRPPAQAGKLNGIGGRVLPGEMIESAMRREFLEEAGVPIDAWRPVLRIAYRQAVVWFLTARATYEQWGCLQSMTDEKVLGYALLHGGLDRADIVDDLRWIIPLALNPTVRLPLELIGRGWNPDMLPAVQPEGPANRVLREGEQPDRSGGGRNPADGAEVVQS